MAFPQERVTHVIAGIAVLTARSRVCGRRLRVAIRAHSHSTGRPTMAEVRDGPRGNSFAWSMPPVAGNPLLTVVTDINGKLLESVASAQKDWAEFVHRRVKENIAASHQI